MTISIVVVSNNLKSGPTARPRSHSAFFHQSDFSLVLLLVTVTCYLNCRLPTTD